jgi:ribosomal protein S27AE
MQELPHGFPFVQCGPFVSAAGPLRQELMNCLRASPVMPLALRDIMRMSDEDAHGRFVAIRFALNNGAPFCPHCGASKVYTLAETPIRWKCSSCRRKFSVTSGTLFHSRKLPILDCN